MKHELILIGGGVRSGKSRYALTLADQLGARRAFIATAEARDGEMQDRIVRHRAERGNAFDTFEEPLHLPSRIDQLTGYDVVVVDCLTLWLSNLLCATESEAAALDRVDELLQALSRRTLHTLIITNEVGMGIVPESRLARMFRDVAGIAHQRLSREADRVYGAMLGTILRLKPGPVEAVSV